MKTKLQIMKFGGTSVGDASCIRRSAQIVANAAREFSVAVVVSAMSGVTNRLIDAAHQAKRGDREAGKAIADVLRKQHNAALAALVTEEPARQRVECRVEEILAEGSRLYEGTALLRELTPRTLDAISSLGERLCAPVFSAALAELDVPGIAIEATELILTNSFHGGAEPQPELTRQNSQARLAPLLKAGQIPIITGFIGATADGVLTTLGRGGSDYSATILGAALDADEIIIWTDVEGVLTADPRLISEARTIPEISYREAAELAYFGAKVLHPKTLRPVLPAGIPVWMQQLCPGKARDENYSAGTQHWRRRQSSHRHSRCCTHQRRRSRHCRRTGCCGANFFHHGAIARGNPADFPVVIAERHLLHRCGLRRAAHGRGAPPRIRAGLVARSGRSHYHRHQHRDRRSSWRKHARHTWRRRAHLPCTGQGRSQRHSHRARFIRNEHFLRRL